MTVRQYSAPLAFKQALEQRLRSATGTDFGRRRQLLVFDRFLARLGRVAGDAVTLKGGLVLELRLERARTTKDVDLRMMGSPEDLLELRQEAGRLDLGDHMKFEIQPDDEHPDIENEGMRYEGYRYRAECRLAGMSCGRPFGVGVAFGDPLIGGPDVITAEDTLAFAGIEPPAIRLYPVVSPIEGKLHALTMPRPRPNTRVRDSARPPSLGDDRADRRRGVPSGHREDLLIPGYTPGSNLDALGAGVLGGALCRDGHRRRADLGRVGGRDAGGLALPRPRVIGG